MDSMNDLDRRLASALQVQPSGDFTARMRTRIANDAPAPRWQVSSLWLAVGAALVIVVIAINLRATPAVPALPVARALPHQDLAIFVPLPAVTSPDAPAMPITAAPHRVVLVEKSEMLALQRLFAGEFVAPPEQPVAEELTINEVAIAPIAVPIIEGEQR